MKKYKCEVCGYIYDPQLGDPDNGIEPGTAFEDLPEDWVCPLCQEGKEAVSYTHLDVYKRQPIRGEAAKPRAPGRKET